MASSLAIFLILGTFFSKLFIKKSISAGNYPIFIKIETGQNARGIAEKLSSQKIISSPVFFRYILKLSELSDEIKAGTYEFENPVSMARVIFRIVRGDYGIETTKVKIPEGLTAKDIANELEKSKLVSFNKIVFLNLAREKEGRLFPDTYFFPLVATEAEIVKMMSDNFSARAGKVNEENLILASILEKEVKSKKDKELVAGILLKRLKNGMRLQVDSAPETYSKSGLPQSPISNPGLESIEASKNPQDSPYWFYLSGKDGATHFAKTFEEHVANKFKYLK